MRAPPHGRDLRKGRVSERGRTYVVTTVTHRRERLFTDLYAGRQVADCLRQAHTDGQCESLAWVLMPDHLHWLFVLEGMALSDLIRQVKSRSAIAVNRMLNRQGPVWQAGFHDHAIRAEEDLRSVARYIVANPLRAGLVQRIGDYPLWDAVWL